MIEKFLQYIRYEKNYSSYTVLSYTEDLAQLRRYAEVNWGGFSPGEITAAQLRAYIIDLMDTGNKVSTVKRKTSAIRSFYKFLNRNNLVAGNPTQRLQPIKGEKSLPKFFLEKDLDKCLEMSENCYTFEDIRDTLVVELLYQTGLRRSEIASLKDNDVDVSQMQLKVVGKGSKERMIPFGPALGRRIESYRQSRMEQVGTQTEQLLVSPKGEPLKPAKIYSIVTKKMGGVTTQAKRSPHVLRHTFATSMLNNGADINAIKGILGHESLAATQVYTHATFSEIQQNYQQAHPRAQKKRR